LGPNGKAYCRSVAWRHRESGSAAEQQLRIIFRFRVSEIETGERPHQREREGDQPKKSEKPLRALVERGQERRQTKAAEPDSGNGQGKLHPCEVRLPLIPDYHEGRRVRAQSLSAPRLRGRCALLGVGTRRRELRLIARRIGLAISRLDEAALGL